MSKVYTAQEMRNCADNCDWRMNPCVAAMLRQAAEILDGILNEIAIIEKMPTADLDGAFENQKVNAERLMAKIAFYQSVKKIVGEVSNG